MDKDIIINSILLEWASKSPDGLLSETFTEEDLEVLHEILLTVETVNEKEAVDFVNEVSMIAEKGKHPERQAYNKNGLLVTFPTPEYKARAIAKGTHFEKDPRASQSNLFGGGQQAPNAAAPVAGAPAAPAAGGAPSMDAKDTALPPSDSGKAQTPPAQKEVPEPGTPGGAVPPSPAPSAGSAPATGTPAQGQLAVEPTPQATTPPNVAPAPAPAPTPPPVQKTPQEIEAEKQVIKQMMDTDDTLPTVPGVGGSGMAENLLKEQLNKLTRVALKMKFNEAVKFLSGHL